MGKMGNVVRVVLAACLLCGLTAGACYAQVENAAKSLMVTDADLATLPVQVAGDEAGLAAEDAAGTTADQTNAILNANSILAADAQSIDGGFEISSTFTSELEDASQADQAVLAGDAGDVGDADGTADSVDAVNGATDVAAELALAEGSYKYLSEYTPIECSVGWKTLVNDANFDGGLISLIVNGTQKSFYKGVSAHAKATLVYDLGADNPYDHFDAYMGIDASRGTNGNALLYAYTSSDNATWTQVASMTATNGKTEAVHIQLDDLTGVRYLKFYFDPNGVNSADHTCLGGAVLYKGSYEEMTDTPVISTVDELTAQLGDATTDQILATKGTGADSLYMTMLRRSLVEKVGYDTFTHAFFDCSDRAKREKMMNWLWNDEEALEDFVTGGTPNSGGYAKSLAVLANLYDAYGSDLDSTEALYTAIPTGTTTAGEATTEGLAQDRGDLYRIVMMAIALTHDNGPYMWQSANQSSDPLERYAAYKRCYEADEDNPTGILRNEVYEHLTVEEMRWVMGGRIWNDEIYWLNRYAYESRPTAGYPLVYSPHYFLAYGKDWNYAAKGYFNLDNYAQYDAKYSLTKYGVNPPTTFSKMWMAFEGSQICWGISYTGTSFANSYGVPSKYVRQPGHAAFFVYNIDASGKATWGIDNNISGWTQTWVNEDTVGNGNARMMCDWGTRYNGVTSEMNASYITLSSTAQDDIADYEKAEALMSLESRCATSDEKIALYQDVLEIMPYHLDAWTKLCQLYAQEKSTAEIAVLAKQLKDSMWYFPLPMHDLMNVLYQGATKAAASAKTAAEAMEESTAKTEALTAATKMYEDAALIALYEENALNRGVNAKNDADAKSLLAQTDICATMASHLLGKLSTELADFSFDGTQAGKIVFGSAYEGVRFRVSTDGGTTWTASGAHVATADESGVVAYDLQAAIDNGELAELTAENDILIWLEGWPGEGDQSQDPVTDSAFRIDILAGATLTSATEANDNEDRFMTVGSNVEYSLDGETDWKPLTTSVSFENYAGRVYARVAAHGRYLAGTCDTSKDFYTFTATKNDDGSYIDSKHVYVPISEISLDSYSSEEASRGDYAANVVDGRLATRWHTLWNGSDADKWVTIKLSEAKYVSQVDYVPIADAGNGTMTACTVYVSMDGLTWMQAATWSGARDNTTKSIVFEQAVYGQYVKIQATSTVGNYASARRFDIFEDTTMASKVMTGFTVTNPTKTSYLEGEKLDLAGAIVTFEYQDGTKVTMSSSLLEPSEEHLYGAGEHVIYLSFGSYVPQPITVTVSARGADFVPTSIDVVALPDKTMFYEGDEFTSEGLEVSATNGTATVLLASTDGYVVTAPDLTVEEGTAQERQVEVTYQGCTTTYTITVKRLPSSLRLVSKPAKDTYQLGEYFDSEGLAVNAVYGTGEGAEEIALEQGDYVLLGTEAFAETGGDIELTVALAGRQSVSASFVVTVYPYFTRDGIRYALVEQEGGDLCIFVRGFSSGTSFIRVPESIQIGSRTYPVRGVEAGAMTGVTGVREIALPGSITTIESGAFTGGAAEGGEGTEGATVGETVENIYLTEHSSFDDLDAAKDAFDSDTNLVLYAASDDLTKDLQSKEFAQELNVQDVTESVASIALDGSYKTSFTRGDAFSYEGLQVMGVIGEGEDAPCVALAPAAYTVSSPDMETVGNQDVAVTFTRKGLTAHYGITVNAPVLHITANPASAVYYRGTDAPAALTVSAVSAKESDVLVYRWYRVTGSAPDVANDVQVGEGDSYTPTESGSYYAVVSVQGHEAESVQSMTADVQMGDFVAVVGTKGYTDLNTAVAAASGQTVHLLKDVTIHSGITVSHSFTLDGADTDPKTGEAIVHTISRESTFKGTFVSVTGSATVTLSNVVLDGGAVWENYYYAQIERGTGNSGIAAQGPLLAASGTSKLYLNEGTVLRNNANSYCDGNPRYNTGGAIRGNDSAAIYMDGAQILDCYSWWFGSAIYFRDTTSLTISGDSMIHGCSGYDAKSTTALCADNTSTLTINGGTFCHNMGYSKGGLMWVGSGKVYINGGTFTDNAFFQSTGGMGTMMYVSGTATVNISDYQALQDIYLTSASQRVNVTGDLTGKAAFDVRCATAGTACVTASTPELLAAAMGTVTIDGKSVAVKDGSLAPVGEGGIVSVASIVRGGTTLDFASVADALSWSADAETITLNADCALTASVTVAHALDIATMGYTLEGAEYLVAGDGYAKKSYGTGQQALVQIVRSDLKIAAASLALQDSVHIRYKVPKSVLDSYTDPYMVFTVEDGGDSRTVRAFTEQGDYIVYVCDKLLPDKMGNTVTAQLYATCNGVVYHSAPVDYSVATYCTNMLAKYVVTDGQDTATQERYRVFRTLLVDLMNYGAAAQTYTNYRTDHLVTEVLTEEQKACASTDRSPYTSVYGITDIPSIEPSVLWKSAALKLESNIAILFKFTADDVSDLSFKVQVKPDLDDESTWTEWTIDGSKAEATTIGESTAGYKVAFDSLNASQLSDRVYITAYRGDTPVSDTLCYSVETYASVVCAENSAYPANLQSLMKAIMRYGDSAKAYKTKWGA